MRKGRSFSLLAAFLAGILGGAAPVRADSGIPISPAPAVDAPDLPKHFQEPFSPAADLDITPYPGDSEYQPLSPSRLKIRKEAQEKEDNWLMDGYNTAMKTVEAKKQAEVEAQREQAKKGAAQDGVIPSMTGTNSVVTGPRIDFRTLKSGQAGQNGQRTDLGFTPFKPLISGIGTDASKSLADKDKEKDRDRDRSSTNSITGLSAGELKALGTTNPDLLRPIQFGGMGATGDTAASDLPATLSPSPTIRSAGLEVPNAPLPRSSPYYSTMAPMAMAAPAAAVAPSANLLAPARSFAPAPPSPVVITPPVAPARAAAQATRANAYTPKIKDPNDLPFSH